MHLLNLQLKLLNLSITLRHSKGTILKQDFVQTLHEILGQPVQSNGWLGKKG